MPKIAMLTARKVLLAIVGLVVLGFAIQLIPFGHTHSNPPVVSEPQWDSPQTRALFMRACGDCHSNETTWPWYSNIAPASWLVEMDVKRGRAAFNVSEWGRGPNKSGEAAQAVQEGEMPPFQYAIIHSAARLTAAEKQAFIQGLITTFGNSGGGGD